MSLTCDQTCWGDGPYPDLADFGDTVWVGEPGNLLYLSGGVYGCLDSYVLTDPAPLIRSNIYTPDHRGAHERVAHTEQRVVDLTVRVSGVETYEGDLNSDPVAGVEENIDRLRAVTINAAGNYLGGANGGVPIYIIRKSGDVWSGRVQFSDFTAEPGRKSRTVTMEIVMPLGELTYDPSPPTFE